MSAEENKAKTRAFYERAINQGDISAIDDLLAPIQIAHMGHGAPIQLTPEILKQVHRANRAAFPDLKVTIESLIAEGDLVVTHATFQGTPTGEWQHPFVGRVHPTGRQVTIRSIEIGRFVDGKSVEVGGISDELGVLLQLGAVIPAGNNPAAV